MGTSSIPCAPRTLNQTLHRGIHAASKMLNKCRYITAGPLETGGLLMERKRLCLHCNSLISKSSWYRHNAVVDAKEPLSFQACEDEVISEERALMDELLYKKLHHNTANRYFEYHLKTLNLRYQSWYLFKKCYQDVTPRLLQFEVCSRGCSLFQEGEEVCRI